jgi:hypothetical protein
MDYTMKISPNNPYQNQGVARENWQRGYDGALYIGYPNSPAYKFYLEGKKAREEESADKE